MEINCVLYSYNYFLLDWYIEKDLGSHIDYASLGQNKLDVNYYHLMQKCDIVVEVDDYLTEGLKTYDFITEIDVNDDSLVELVVYSTSKSSLFLMKQFEPFLTGFGWNSQFWIRVN